MTILASIFADIMECPLHPAQWSILTLEPIAEQATAKPTTLLSLYSDAFTDSQFQQLFILGIVMFYGLDVFGCYLYDEFVSSSDKKKVQREQFAGQFISIIHALMISIASTSILLYYDAFDAFHAPPDDPLIFIYKCCSVFSGSYFFLDALFIGIYYKQAMNKKVAFLLHHACVGFCMCGVHFTHPIITYIAALNYIIEWSTVILTLRVFARIWSHSYLYFISGCVLIVSYPFFRILYISCLVFISFNSQYLAHYGFNTAGSMVGGTQIFVLLLSSYYYFAIIMRKPKQIYTLNKANVF